jgi:CTP:molybdopterin cytidylyltransferase MocA
VLFPWPLAAEVAQLGVDEGLNAIVARHGVAYVEAASDAISQDFDTPEDYDRLKARYGK